MLEIILAAVFSVAPRGDLVVETPSATAVSTASTAADATIHRKTLPKAVSRALRRKQATLRVEGRRHIVHPTAAHLAKLSHRAATLWVSEDEGQTWREVTLPECGNAGCVLRVERGGALQFMTGHEAGCGGGDQERLVGHVDGREWRAAPWPWDSPFAYQLPADGWAAADCSPPEGFEGPDRVPCLVDLEGREVYLPVAWDDDETRPLVVDVIAGTVSYAGRRFPLRGVGGE
jgi:hypothetical protein